VEYYGRRHRNLAMVEGRPVRHQSMRARHNFIGSVIAPVAALRTSEGRKPFFFEKKKQKTFSFHKNSDETGDLAKNKSFLLF